MAHKNKKELCSLYATGRFSRRFDWNLQGNISYISENISFLDSRSVVNASGHPVVVFMGKDELAPEYSHQFEEMQAVCPEKHLELLLSDENKNKDIPYQPVAWLDERSST